jgi:hypothetical protein
VVWHLFICCALVEFSARIAEANSKIFFIE